MATGITLTAGQLRALRILAQHESVAEGEQTLDDDHDAGPAINWRTAQAFRQMHLADPFYAGTASRWRIRSKGRQVLREHGVDA